MIYAPTWADVAAGGYRHHPRYRGCVGHYIFQERGGTTLYDIVNYRNNGTLIDMTPSTDWVSSTNGNGLDFTHGANNRVKAATPSWSNLPQFTAVVDVVHTNNAAALSQTVLVNNNNDNNNLTHNLMIFVFTDGNVYGRYGNGVGIVTANAATTVGRHQWVLTLDDSNLTLWEDAVQIAQTARNGNPSTATHVFIGADADPTDGIGAFAFDGIVNQARIYNRRWTRGEITSFYLDPWLEFEEYKPAFYFFTAAELLSQTQMSALMFGMPFRGPLVAVDDPGFTQGNRQAALFMYSQILALQGGITIRQLSDALDIVDARLAALNALKTESYSITDDATVTRIISVILLSLADTLDMSDAQIKYLVKTIGDIGDSSDSTSAALDKIFADAQYPITDDATITRIVAQTILQLADSLFIADISNKTLTKTAGDLGLFQDASLSALNKIVGDRQDISDLATATKAALLVLLQLAESILLADTQTKSLTKTAGDNAELTEQQQYQGTRLFGELQAAQDVIASALAKTIVENTTLIDILTREIQKILSDNVSLTDTATTQRIAQLIALDIAEVQDVRDSFLKLLFKTIVDNVDVVDATTISTILASPIIAQFIEAMISGVQDIQGLTAGKGDQSHYITDTGDEVHYVVRTRGIRH